jgi:membrane protein YdbS with pleckstrin-like domain
MNCPKCGSQVASEAIFCQHCGERVDPASAFSPHETVSAAAGTAETVTQPPTTPDAATQPPRSTLNEVLWEGRFSGKAMMNRVVLSAAVTVLVIIGCAYFGKGIVWTIGLAMVLSFWLYQLGVYLQRRLGECYRLNSQTLIHEKGILVRSSSPIEIIRIDDIVLEQALLERWLGVGTIIVMSNDPTDPRLELKGIANVTEAFDKIDQARRAERRLRAVRVEAM